jgi:ketohexokinase
VNPTLIDAACSFFGNVVYDKIIKAPSFPLEDSENRVDTVIDVIGGNVANTLKVLDQASLKCTWYGVLPNNQDGNEIKQQLEGLNTQVNSFPLDSRYSIPTSYIISSLANGSRTVLHHRDMPEYSYDHFLATEYCYTPWLHMEVRNPTEQKQILSHIKERFPTTKIVIEIEKLRPGFEEVVFFADYVVYSKAFVNSIGQSEPMHFLKTLTDTNKISFLTWGEEGAGCVVENNITWQSTTKITPIDSVGAGDVFNAGILLGLIAERPIADVLKQAVDLATRKCLTDGFEGIIRQSL